MLVSEKFLRVTVFGRVNVWCIMSRLTAQAKWSENELVSMWDVTCCMGVGRAGGDLKNILSMSVQAPVSASRVGSVTNGAKS